MHCCFTGSTARERPLCWLQTCCLLGVVAILELSASRTELGNGPTGAETRGTPQADATRWPAETQRATTTTWDETARHLSASASAESRSGLTAARDGCAGVLAKRAGPEGRRRRRLAVGVRPARRRRGRSRRPLARRTLSLPMVVDRRTGSSC